MSRLKVVLSLCLALVLLMSAGAVRATTLHVNCGGSGGLPSIGAALKVLQNSEGHEPSTINVSGACHENVLIQNMDRLTIAGSNGASINDPTNAAADVIDVDNSQVTISGFTINGGYDGIDCYYGSFCHLIGNTFQGAADAGIVIFDSITRAKIDGGIVQNNPTGLSVTGDVIASAMTVQGNSYIGVAVSRGGRFMLSKSVLANNQVYGLWTQGGNVVCRGCQITGNQLGGVYVDLGSDVSLVGYVHPVTISGNGNPEVVVADAGVASFLGTVNVTGASGYAIFCNSVTAVTRFAIAAAGGAANTNCTN